MAHITDEQILGMIRMNARDFRTILDENAQGFEDFNKEHPNLHLSTDNFMSACVTQFIRLKNNRNFGAVKTNEKGEEKPSEPEPKKEFHIKDPESPMTPAQHDGIEKMLRIPGAPMVVNDFRTAHNIDGGWESLNKGQASDLMDILVQWSKEKKKEAKK